MYPVGAMAYSDAVVLNVLKDLLAERGEQEVISVKDVSLASEIPAITCQRALERLRKSGRVQGEFTVGVGYRYRIVNGSSAGR